jgi:hypothetical protein
MDFYAMFLTFIEFSYNYRFIDIVGLNFLTINFR